MANATLSPGSAAMPLPPHLTSLTRLAAVMCCAVAIGGALAELALAWIWLSPDYVERFVAPHVGLAPGVAALDGWTRVLGFVLSMVPLSVLLYALNQAYKLFDAYRQGDVFSNTATLRLRRIGLAMLALAPLKPLTGAALSMVLTMTNPPGQKMLSIGISIDDYMIAVFGGLVLAIAHVMIEGERLADDQRHII